MTPPRWQPSWEARLGSAATGLEKDLGIGSSFWLVLALIGCLADADRGSFRVRLLAALFLSVLVVGSFLGPLRIVYVSRYVMPILVLLPTLTLAGVVFPFRLFFAAGKASPQWVWLPSLIVSALFCTLAPTTIGLQAARNDVQFSVPIRQIQVEDPALDLLIPGDAVIDLTLTRLPASRYMNRFDVVFATYEGVETPPIRIPASDHSRRFVFLLGMEPPWWKELLTELDDSARFEQVRPRIYQDLRPGEEAILLKAYRLQRNGSSAAPDLGDPHRREQGHD